MIKCKGIVNKIFTSKTYIIYREGENKAWLVDIGDIDPVLAFLEEKHLIAAGVFLTHAHFDHIYGILSLLDNYPNCRVFATAYTKQALASDRLNLSRYHGNSITYEGENVNVVIDGDEIVIFDGEPILELYETPGHNPGCLTMVMGDMIFTGDAYIPGIGANTRVPRSNKEQAKQSLERIMELAKGKKVFPGHLV